MAKILRQVDGTLTEVAAPDVFVQESAPTFTANGLWIELNPDDTVKTFWIETGF